MSDLLFVHGMGGSPADWLWVQEKVAGDALSMNVRAESPELCAHSLTQQLPTDRPYSLVGYSMGGRISLLALDQISRAGAILPRNLILVSTGFGLETPAAREERRQKDEKWGELARQDPDEFWIQWYSQEIFSTFRQLPPGHKQAWEKSRNALDIGALSNQMARLGPGCHHYLLPILEKLVSRGVRVLYIVGELDKKYLELSGRIRKIQGVSVATVPAAGHILPLEAPGPLAELIARHLADAGSR